MHSHTTYPLKKALVLLIIFMMGCISLLPANVFVIFYATHKGKTGHTGIAIDRYDIYVYDRVQNNELYSVNDTQSTGNLVYFDLWPKSDAFIRKHLKRDLEPSYYRLPRTSGDAPITISSLLSKGIPHKEGQPVDGLVEIETCPYQDFQLITYLQEVADAEKCFNAQLFNCTDFVCKGLTIITGKKFSAKERVLFSRFSTPNRLFRNLEHSKQLETHILKHPGEQMQGSFLAQRIVPELKTRIRKKITIQL
ncbi:MAG TPA: hypothetical protein VFF27_04385 [Bacteroidia bacterium]|jgi:hypothetical protein|nr:hypothetical protein [Bacteroidia bacterium]